MSLRITSAPRRPLPRRSPAGRLAAWLLDGPRDGRELPFEVVDGVWRPPARDPAPTEDPPLGLYTARGRLRALVVPTLGRRVDLHA